MLNTIELGWGITLLDTHFQRPNMAACYILQDAGEVAIIETGTKDTVPLIFECLKKLELKPELIKYIIPTHVHLDHAGGVGLLMEQLPLAQLVVHAKGARHMIDPAKLQAGATAVYGEAEFNKTYGDLIPVAAHRVFSPADEEVLTLGNRTLTFVDTPGHARHHFCVFDSISQGFFTGDTFGLAYQELTNQNGPFIFPTTTPVQFDPVALKDSIKNLIGYSPKRMFLTHYGMVENPAPLADSLIGQVDELVKIALEHQQKNVSNCVDTLTEILLQHFLTKLEQHNCELSVEEQKEIIITDVRLNAQGLCVWLDNRATNNS